MNPVTDWVGTWHCLKNSRLGILTLARTFGVVLRLFVNRTASKRPSGSAFLRLAVHGHTGSTCCWRGAEGDACEDAVVPQEQQPTPKAIEALQGALPPPERPRKIGQTVVPLKKHLQLRHRLKTADVQLLQCFRGLKALHPPKQGHDQMINESGPTGNWIGCLLGW